MRQVYLDNAASTPVDERALDAMLPYFRLECGNPSSLHSMGVRAREAVETARATLARCLNAQPEEIVFTSSGTESNNLAIKGYAFANRDKGRHLVVSSIEHECVLGSAEWLAGQGFEVTVLNVDNEGLVDPDEFRRNLRPDTILASVMHANNEIGTIEPIAALGALCQERGICFHTDACQSFGKLPLDVKSLRVDMVTINAHKLHGPKGVGALYVRNGLKLGCWQHGGGQESGLRSATENVPGIVGFAVAARLAMEAMPQEMPRLQRLRDKLIASIRDELPCAYLNGSEERRLPTNVNFGFEGFEGQSPNLLLALDGAGITVSTGSACSAKKSSSHVLRAIGRDPLQAIGALRLSLGRFTTEDDIDYFLAALPEAMRNLKSLRPR